MLYTQNQSTFQHPSKNNPKSTLQLGSFFGSILGWIWAQVGAKLGPSWLQNPSKIDPRTDGNQDEICKAFLIALGTQLGSKMGRFVGPVGPPNHSKIHPKTTSKKMAIKK